MGKSLNPKTQRALARYWRDSLMSAETATACLRVVPDTTAVPVLVVPEAAVSKCKHDWRYHWPDAEWCAICGALRSFGRITRPRVLRVGRSR